MKFAAGMNGADIRSHENFGDSKLPMKNTDSMFKPSLNMKKEPEDLIRIDQQQRPDHNTWSSSSAGERMMCDSTSGPQSSSHIFKVPFPVSESRPQSNRISQITPSEFLEKYANNSNQGERPIGTPSSIRSTILDLPGSRNSGRNSGSFTRFSGRGKKRMLSVSPMSSDILDLNEVIRTSPNSLVAFVNSNEYRSGFISRGSTGRNSSAASHGSHGSYGHLSPSPFSTQICSRQKNHFATSESPLLLQQHFKHQRQRNAPQSSRDSTVTSSTGNFPFHSHVPNNNQHKSVSVEIIRHKQQEEHKQQQKQKQQQQQQHARQTAATSTTQNKNDYDEMTTSEVCCYRTHNILPTEVFCLGENLAM